MISLAILAWILVASYAPAVSVAAGEYNVRDFGAKGNGTTLDTMSIQKAVDACVQAGGGTVHFPAGVYLSQPLHLGSRTTWQIDPGATIKATDDPQDYLPPDVSWDEILSGAKRGPFLSFISGKDLTDVTLCGGGTIDGSGARWWVIPCQGRI
jgi:polygalacturonase